MNKLVNDNAQAVVASKPREIRREEGLDWLKLVLSFMVVGIHARPFLSESKLLSDVLANGLFRVAVPCFFVINGYFLPEFSRRSVWLRRVVLLYALWMIAYLPFYLPHNLDVLSVVKLLKTIFFGYFHLWYVSAYIFAGLVIIYFEEKFSGKEVFFVFALYFFGVLLQYFSFCAFYGYEIKGVFYKNFLFFALPMMLVGRAIRRGRMLHLGTVWSASIGGCVLLAEILLMRYFHQTGGDVDVLAAMIFIAPAVFVFFKSVEVPGFLKLQRMHQVASAVYFVHPGFIMLWSLVFGVEFGTKMFIIVLLPSLLLSFVLIGLGRFTKLII